MIGYLWSCCLILYRWRRIQMVAERLRAMKGVLLVEVRPSPHGADARIRVFRLIGEEVHEFEFDVSDDGTGVQL